MRRPASLLPRYTVWLAVVLALGLNACSSVSSPVGSAKPAGSQMTVPPPPPPAAPIAKPAPSPPQSVPPLEQKPLPPVPAVLPLVPPTPLSVAPPTVAILLPLTGPSAAIGAALFNAAQLALFELADGNFTLLPFDTKGTAEGAAAAARQALAQHAGLIIGPLFSAEAKAVAALTKPAGISVVALTADRAAAGPGVYVLGFLPGPQALRVAEFAHAQGRNRLAVLAPSNDYGRTVVEYLTNFGAPLGVTVSVLQYYDAEAGDLTVPLKRLVKPNAKQPGDPGFDALLLPDEGPRLRNLAGLLAGQGIDPAQIKLLGTMLWEDSRPNTVAALSGGWYAASAPAAHSDFDQRFAKAFGAKPPRLASLGYDATALAAVLARQGGLGFTPAGLTNPLGFAGVDGLFRLKNDGTTERGYAVMEVVPDGQPHEVSPAPGSFLP